MVRRLANKGFTLIELLIVIVIIGILATAVLSAINPIEQINKAQDQGRKSNAAELVNALERYYTTFEYYPWEAPTTLGTTPGSAGSSGVVVQNTSGTNEAWLGQRNDASNVGSLIGTQELKPDFAERSDLQDMLIYLYGNQGNLVRVCFTPESNNFLQQANFTNGDFATTGGNQICVPE